MKGGNIVGLQKWLRTKVLVGRSSRESDRPTIAAQPHRCGKEYRRQCQSGPHEYLRTATEARQIVLRIAPANTASLKLAEKAGFTCWGLFDEPEGRIRDIRS
jgi:hypothetical protein